MGGGAKGLPPGQVEPGAGRLPLLGTPGRGALAARAESGHLPGGLAALPGRGRRGSVPGGGRLPPRGGQEARSRRAVAGEPHRGLRRGRPV